jgi:hypothetical protein
MTSYRSLAASILLSTLESPSTAAFIFPPHHNVARILARSTAVRLQSARSDKPPAADEPAEEYVYDEAEFADYSSDYSDVPALVDDEGAGIADLYEDYEDIGGFDLSPFEKHGERWTSCAAACRRPRFPFTAFPLQRGKCF